MLQIGIEWLPFRTFLLCFCYAMLAPRKRVVTSNQMGDRPTKKHTKKIPDFLQKE